MGDRFWDTVVAITGTVGAVAIVAVVLSKKSQTPAVLQNFFSGYGNALAAAESPVTGASAQPNLSYSGELLGGSLGFTPTFAGGFG